MSYPVQTTPDWWGRAEQLLCTKAQFAIQITAITLLWFTVDIISPTEMHSITPASAGTGAICSRWDEIDVASVKRADHHQPIPTEAQIDYTLRFGVMAL
jgi:hypothetical protein